MWVVCVDVTHFTVKIVKFKLPYFIDFESDLYEMQFPSMTPLKERFA